MGDEGPSLSCLAVPGGAVLAALFVMSLRMVRAGMGGLQLLLLLTLVVVMRLDLLVGVQAAHFLTALRVCWVQLNVLVTSL